MPLITPARAMQSISFDDSHRPRQEFAGQRRSLRPGCPLFLEGDRAECVFRVVKGRVHLATSAAIGSSSILRIVTEGRFLGISSVLLQESYEGFAIAVVTTTVEVFPSAFFRKLMDQFPEFAATITLALSREYLEMIEYSKRMQLEGNTQQRVARLLVGCIRGKGTSLSVELPYRHNEIGGMIGRSRENVTRTLTLFKQQGIIDIVDRRLKIRRPKYLILLAAPS